MSNQNTANQNQQKFSRNQMGHMGGPVGNFEKAKNFKGTMNKLLQYLSIYKIAFLIVSIFAVGSSIFSIIGPKYLGKATTKLFEGLIGKVTGAEGAAIDFGYIGNIVLLLLGLYLLSAVFSFIQGFIVTDIAQKVSYQLRKDISEKMNRLPLKYFDKKNHGEILSRVTNDVDTVSQTLNQSLSQIITSIVTIVGVFIMMISISWMMTLTLLIILPLSFILIMLVMKKSQKYFKDQQAYLGHVNGHVEEFFSGHTTMKAFNLEGEVVKKFDELNDTLYHSAWKSQFLSGMMMPMMTFIGNLGYVLVTILGGWLTIKKTIEVGDILAFVQYIRQFTMPLGQVAQVATIFQSTAAAAERVFEFLEEEEESPNTDHPLSVEKISGEVTFKNVRFGYHADKVIIKDFSSHIKPGQKVAIVGPTGAGKTTIVKLLMRFYDLNSGDIFIDGHNIIQFQRNELRKWFGMVLQDTWLFHGTIMENIRYSRPEATDQEVIQAAKMAHAHHFINTLPNGYQMEINEESNNISQGQKQLLTIARAILADPKILILDEATSSVDTRTEVLIQKAMENLMQGRTNFIIAHRLSTIRNADLILVMNDGDIVEQGTHDELLETNGFYATMYNSQFEHEFVS